MKLNYLSIALATALATTLTACGSDNSSNYNQPTVSPAPQAKPDAGAKPGNDAGTSKPGNDAGTNKPAEENKKPEGDANKKPEGDANKKPDGDADADKKPEKQQPEKQEEGKKPQAPQPENKVTNPGNAANPGNITTDNFVVAQNYIRGNGSNFDKNNNPNKIGNASVVGFNELNNQYMSNIILARVTDGKKLNNIYAGEQPGQVDNNAYNDTDTTGAINNLQQPHALQHLNDTDFTNVPSQGSNQSSNLFSIVDATTTDADLVTGYANQFYAAGLVRAYKAADNTGTNNRSFFVRGQENPVFTIDKNGRFVVTNPTGSIADAATAVTTAVNAAATAANTASEAKNATATSVSNAIVDAANQIVSNAAANATTIGDATVAEAAVRAVSAAARAAATATATAADVAAAATAAADTIATAAATTFDDVRMFGSLSQVNDVPARRWNPTEKQFEANPGYNTNTTGQPTQNAWRFDVDGRNNAIKQQVTRNQTVTLQDAIAPTTLHLDHVQYGRVTANTDEDAIRRLQASYDNNVEFHQFLTTAKRNEQHGQLAAEFDRTDTSIDYYFARGLEPTKKMPTEGTVKYLGHALTYGLDNSFHGGGDPNITNTARQTPRHAIGNFVAATLDTATKTVNGSIYNVWTNNAGNLGEGVVKDNLVTFEGKVQGNTNSVLGDAKLAYTPKVADTPTTASFRGGFFGENASELAGNINTTKEGYENTAWGAVFGAKSNQARPSLPVENQVEAQKTAPATAETK